MRKMTAAAIGLLVLLVGLTGACKKKTAKVEPFQHTAENTHDRVHELRLKLMEAMERRDLRYIHDMMNYFKATLTGLSMGLEGERKQRVDKLTRDLTLLSHQIDNSAGRGNQAATEANLQKLVDVLKDVEAELKEASK